MITAIQRTNNMATFSSNSMITGLIFCALVPLSSHANVNACDISEQQPSYQIGLDRDGYAVKVLSKEDGTSSSCLQTLANSTIVVHFGFDQAILLPSQAKLIQQYLQTHQPEVLQASIEVTGFTDAVGEKNYNRRLGLMRASVVSEYIQSQGIPASQILMKSLGESEPAATNQTSDGREQNRRVTIVFSDND